MTNQTKFFMSLGGSQAGVSVSRFCTLTLAAIVAIGGTIAAPAQDKPEAAKAAKAAEKKAPAKNPAEKIMGGYHVHSMVELCGRIRERSASDAKWSTNVNQSTGMRVLGQEMEMHTVNPSKTPFFDTLSTSSYGYGGDPYDMSMLKATKGRWYDFTGTFRRDRNYFDYNLLANSFLGPNALVQEPDSLHIFNTVRRNTDTVLTLFPVSVVHFRAGYNHGTHEGPSYSSVHEGGDVQVLQWFRNSNDTFTGGVDVNLAKRSTLSYDQLFVLYKGDSPYQLAGATYQLSDGTPASLGVDTLATATCGSGAKKTLEVVNGIVNPYCSLSTAQSQTAPTRTMFPTEQLRFSSHYWDRVAMNGRATYAGGISNVNHFNETFTGLLARTFTRQQIDTGGLAGGRLAHNKHYSTNADYGIEAELEKHVSLSDAVNFWSFRNEGANTMVTQLWAGSATTTPPLNAFTPLSSLTPVTTTSTGGGALAQRNLGNTVLGIVTFTPQFRLSGGWRFNSRQITKDTDAPLQWHENWLLLGSVYQPTRTVRLTLNYDQMTSKAANSLTPSDTYTREAPNKTYHLRGRATAKPAKWINFAVSGNGFWGKNNDPLVNHVEHNFDLSFGTQVVANDNLSFDFNVARDAVYSKTDICYLYSTTNPFGDTNAGTCVPTAANPTATSNLLLGNGYYSAPSTFVSGALNYSPIARVHLYGGARVNTVSGAAELLNPYQVPGALNSQRISPFADMQLAIAPQWTWHANWDHEGYSDSGGFGPASRNFRGDIVSLSVKYAF